MSVHNKNFLNLDKINAGKHCYYSKQHINYAHLCAQINSNIAQRIRSTPTSAGDS